jgi:putative restriction endonuclease
MAKAIFYHKDGSGYKDVRGRLYHFPKMYLSRVQQAQNDWIVYYGPLMGLPSRYYSGLAKVALIRADDDLPDHYYADSPTTWTSIARSTIGRRAATSGD